MEGKSSSSSSDDPSTPRTRNTEVLQDLVKQLEQSSKRSMPQISTFMNLLQKLPVSSQNNSDRSGDWVSLHDRLLLIPSSYLSTMLGGFSQKSKPNRMTGLARLEAICARARPEGKLVLEYPETNHTDVTDLEQMPLMQAKILSSEQNKTTLGDNSGFPVRRLLAISRDQVYYLHLNAACLVVRKPHQDYAFLNTDARNAYQGAFKILVEGVFSFSDEAELMQKCIDLATTPENTKNFFHCNNHPFHDVSLYTAFMIRHYLFSIVGIDNQLIKCVLSLTQPLEFMVKNLIPELRKVEEIDGVDLSSMDKFIEFVDEWWKDSPFLSIRDTLYKTELTTAQYLTKYDTTELSEMITTPLESLRKVIAEIRVIRMIHPSDDTCSETITPIHEFSCLLLHHSQLILNQVEVVVQSMGNVTDGMSFLNVYGELRKRYIATYGIKVGVKPKTNGQVSPIQNGSAHQSSEVDNHSGAGFFSPGYRASPSPPTTRMSQVPQNGAGNDSRGKSSSTHNSPRLESTASTPGQMPKSPRPEYPSSVSSQLPRSPRLDSRRSASVGLEASQNATGSSLARTTSGKLNQGGEVTLTPTAASNPGSTKISPAGSAKQSPSSSARGSPREREQQRGTEQGGAVDVTASRYGGKGSLRRRSLAKSTANAVPPTVQSLSFDTTSEYGVRK